MTDGEISFTYAGCNVTVKSDGSIYVTDHQRTGVVAGPVGDD